VLVIKGHFTSVKYRSVPIEWSTLRSYTRYDTA
jgi:hypothetical protein